MESGDFVSRVSTIPLVNSALRAYEQSKASSRVVKVCCQFMPVNALLIGIQYGAEMMESSMRSISKPVINRLPVNQIDEFACRQLDRVSNFKGGDRDLLRDFHHSSEEQVMAARQSMIVHVPLTRTSIRKKTSKIRISEIL